ncbi:MAG TPA: ATP-binding protein [Solirubrobacteraceae bacterium]|nr:ATP-binding protein [Solirubrobacteraceae bacterium]
MELSSGRRDISEEPMLRLDLERSPEAPSLARAAIVGFFEGHDLSPSAVATLTLLVSELVSNAVIHSDAPAASVISLRARPLDDGSVRVEVTDQGSGFTPVPRDQERHRGGYGLYLVDKQATRWGVDRKDGVRVWFELPSDDG